MPLPIFTAIQHGRFTFYHHRVISFPCVIIIILSSIVRPNLVFILLESHLTDVRVKSLPEIPPEQEKPLEEVRVQRDYLVDSSRYDVLRKEEEELEKKTRWLWYEFTPYEVGCDELGVCSFLLRLFSSTLFVDYSHVLTPIVLGLDS